MTKIIGVVFVVDKYYKRQRIKHCRLLNLHYLILSLSAVNIPMLLCLRSINKSYTYIQSFAIWKGGVGPGRNFFLCVCFCILVPVLALWRTLNNTETKWRMELELGCEGLVALIFIFYFPTVQQGGQVILTCIHYNYIFSPTHGSLLIHLYIFCSGNPLVGINM